MKRGLANLSLRYLLRHRWWFLLSVLGVALGVAVVVGLDIATTSARTAFRLASSGVMGRATHQIVGGPSGVPEAVYRDVRRTHKTFPIAPMIEGYASLPDSGISLTIIGIDPFAEGPFRDSLPGLADDGSITMSPAGSIAFHSNGSKSDYADLLRAFLTAPGAVLLTAATARDLKLTAGDVFPLQVGGRRRDALVVAVIGDADRPDPRLDHLLIADIATVQEWLGMSGFISRIDLIRPEGEDEDSFVARVTAELPPSLIVKPAAYRIAQADALIRSFMRNLDALSLLVLLVGLFLIYNTMTFAAVRRRPLIGMLRALGVTRGEIAASVLAEAMLIGLLGTLAGVAIGLGLGRALLGIVSRTINDLYFVVAVNRTVFTAAMVVKACVLGIAATVFAGLVPAWESSVTPPRLVMHRSRLEVLRSRGVPRAAVCGVALAATGGLIALYSGHSMILGFVALFLVVMGIAFCVPLCMTIVIRLLTPLTGRLFGVLGRLSVAGITASLSRTAVAVAALTVALSVALSIGLSIASFRATVAHWLSRTLDADIYVSIPGYVTRHTDAVLDPTLVQSLMTAPGIAGGYSYYEGRVPAGPAGEVEILVFEMSRAKFNRLLIRGLGDAVWREVTVEGAVLASEPLAYRLGLKSGDSIHLTGTDGERGFRVAGVLTEYSSEGGLILMSRATYQRFWPEPGVSLLGLYLAAGADVRQVVAQLRALVSPGQDVLVRQVKDLRETSLAIFDRTFVITEAMRTLAMAVAFIGVLSALLAIQADRVRELAVLRALGLTPGQLGLVVTGQSVLMGLIAGVFSMAASLVLALVVIHVINKRSFGWSLPFHPDLALLLQGLALAVGAALLAGLYPAWRMATATPALALREE